jgi:hypothetical protein
MSHELDVIEQHRCLHLLSKGLYINAGLAGDERLVGDGNFWCGRTQRFLGPDQELCDHEHCTDPSRHCYVPR